MKERPILFSTPMVQAILEGRKTMTRRIVKPQPFLNKEYSSNAPPREWWSMRGSHNDCPIKWIEFCPYGKIGDRLWVRETFNLARMPMGKQGYRYKADWPSVIKGWKPSIHMPRIASRITLEITNIRVERLQDISEQDAINEGAPDSFPISDMALLTGLGDWQIPRPFLIHQFSFLNLWCKIYSTD